MTSQPSVPDKPAQPPAVARPRRWDPFALFDEMREEMARLFDFGWPLARPAGRPLAPGFTWAPRMDVFEKDGQLVVKAEVPGVSKDDIRITVQDGDLVIEGERKSESEVKEDAYYRLERSYGSFYRRLALPTGVNPDAITAEYKDGVLEVRIPKAETPEPAAKRIPIS